mmetsp:Transcript_10882/g.26109  ORF Transcript_10882/g.26109 Transcript_10882/m.26109 type:complete len:274 (-) Transcript_10882:418-1239(-)
MSVCARGSFFRFSTALIISASSFSICISWLFRVSFSPAILPALSRVVSILSSLFCISLNFFCPFLTCANLVSLCMRACFCSCVSSFFFGGAGAGLFFFFPAAGVGCRLGSFGGGLAGSKGFATAARRAKCSCWHSSCKPGGTTSCPSSSPQSLPLIAYRSIKESHVARTMYCHAAVLKWSQKKTTLKPFSGLFSLCTAKVTFTTLIVKARKRLRVSARAPSPAILSNHLGAKIAHRTCRIASFLSVAQTTLRSLKMKRLSMENNVFTAAHNIW